ncbi:MAG: CehA/McbA family metallohydrolase [Duganella sp.]
MGTVTFLAAILGLCCTFPATVMADSEHREFDAYLQAPFRSAADGTRTITLHFSYPGAAPEAATVRWRLHLLHPDGRVLQRWRGVRSLGTTSVAVAIRWRAQVPALRAGIYQLQLRATLFLQGKTDTIEQQWPVAAGSPSAAAAIRPALPGAAPDQHYTIYLGNLHSQTNHSDGGAAIDHCDGAQKPQTGAYGPDHAYGYAQRHGLDFLMTSEHNHMFDGATGASPQADASAARALYQQGMQAAQQWNRQHAGFLALYGQEWGVIDGGGHLNILNGDSLLGWERNAAGELLADIATPRDDYASLYALMRERGWHGQFNHPRNGQFNINGQALAWSSDGHAAMLLCEVMNSSAYSNRSDESEPRLSNFESACNQLLEAGYHLAFSSNQDNHCANWGASAGNRTGVLLRREEALTPQSFLAALQARRVFATMDKHGTLILTANGHMMGQQLRHQGPLTLEIHHRNSNGHRLAALQLLHGVPGRRGQVTVVSDSASTMLTPEPGEHFYYARATQDNGAVLWSAPIWVSQQPATK